MSDAARRAASASMPVRAYGNPLAPYNVSYASARRAARALSRCSSRRVAASPAACASASRARSVAELPTSSSVICDAGTRANTPDHSPARPVGFGKKNGK